MVEINLYPWRQSVYRTRNKRILFLCALVFLMTIIIFLKMYFVMSKNNKKLYVEMTSLKTANQKLLSMQSVPFDHLSVKNKKFQIKKNKNQLFDVKFEDVSLAESFKILGRYLHQDLIVSESVSGNVSFIFHNISLQKVFSILLAKYHLIKMVDHSVWIIAPLDEWIENKQNLVKWHDFLIRVATLETKLFQLHYTKADEIARLFQKNALGLLSARGTVQADVRTNQLLVSDVSQNFSKIKKFVQQMDVPIQQVLIEARLASIDIDFERELGVDFSVRSAETSPDEGASAQVDSQHFALLAAKLVDGNLLDVRLAAAENTGHGELISSPKLFTANRQTASIESGEEIPYQEISRSGATGVSFKKAVLSLQVTPQILPGSKVLLELQIHQDKPTSRMVLGVPAISTRQLKSSILVRDGETIVLGGIFETSQRDDRAKLPFLSDLPGLGVLFQQKTVAKNRRELLIFVTPHVVK